MLLVDDIYEPNDYEGDQDMPESDWCAVESGLFGDC